MVSIANRQSTDKRSPSVWLPYGFDPVTLLGSCLRTPADADRVRWILNLVLRKQAHHDTDAYGYTRINMEILRRQIGQPASRLCRAITDKGVFETSPHIAGVRSRGYRVGDSLLDLEARRARLVEPTLVERIGRELEELQKQREVTWLPIHHQLREIQQLLTIIPEAHTALAALASQSRLCQSVLVGNLERRHPSFSVSNTRRVFNGLTGLSRSLRTFVRLDHEPISALDLRNAQPAMLALLLHPSEAKGPSEYKTRFLGCLSSSSSPLPADRSSVSGLLASFRHRFSSHSFAVLDDYWSFLDLVRSGDLWSHLIALCLSAGVPLPNGDAARDHVKRLLLRDVIAKRGRYPSPFERVFAEAFPSICQFVWWANAEHHATLICVLQRIESWLVVENVAPKLVGRIPIVTLHDAIYSRTRDRPLVHQAFEDVFKELGCRLGLKEE